jgi:uncharacterized protein (DUF305 family)
MVFQSAPTEGSGFTPSGRDPVFRRKTGGAIIEAMVSKPALTLVVLATIAWTRVVGQATAGAPANTPRRDYTAADVRFMSGMIYHHAQAVLIAGWAPTHDASPSLRALCERIVVGQRDEIALMQRWLQDRHEAVPDPNTPHAMMPEMDPATMMPGMLTGGQLAQLDRARGPEFDRLFLTFMIQHHQGAITMVNQLFGQGAGEQEKVFRFASDVFADQTTEIARMQKMLAALLFRTTGQ